MKSLQFFVKFEKYYSIGKVSVGLFIALGIFSISRNLEPTAKKNITSNLCAKLEALIKIRRNFEFYLSEQKNDIQENIKKTNQQLEAHMNIKTRFADQGSLKGEYLYSGDYLCRTRERRRGD